MPTYEPPAIPTLPVEYGCVPRYSITAWLSRASRGEKKLPSRLPPLPPVPRTSTTAPTMPRVAQKSGG